VACGGHPHWRRGAHRQNRARRRRTEGRVGVTRAAVCKVWVGTMRLARRVGAACGRQTLGLERFRYSWASIDFET
jgi:hypothetical protein